MGHNKTGCKGINNNAILIRRMQAAMWELTPDQKTQKRFSMLEESSYETYSRFREYAELFPTIRKISYEKRPEKERDIREDIVAVEGEIKERKTRLKSGNMTSHFKVTKANIISQRNAKNMVIPIQPRKGHEVFHF